MNILIIGSGGREHALAWKIAQSPQVRQIFVAPGNPGTALEPKVLNIAIKPLDFPGLIQFAKENSVDLTIVGPELPLTEGIVDAFRKEGLACFGPTKAAAKLEGSKAFTKEFLAKYQIPTAKSATFTDAVKAKNFVNQQTFPLVIKADGLAAGKGVVIAQTRSEAYQAIDAMLKDLAFGEAGQTIVIEEFLSGIEASFIIITDGHHFIPLATSQDHKTRDDNDQGPNTGGMGAYSPAAWISETLYDEIVGTIIEPTLAGLRDSGVEYNGFLYVGLMISADNHPKVLEYNCRLGDPETQVILMRLRSDLVQLCQASLQQQLHSTTINWHPGYALGIVLAADGYPHQYRKGDIIRGLTAPFEQDVKIFHAGTANDNDEIVTHGGRVLCVTALRKTLLDAQQAAYNAVEMIDFTGMQYRTDIGKKALPE